MQAVFLDRDGVLNVYLPDRYVENPDQLVILPGVATAIRSLNDAGIKVIVISNQQGVGRGIMTAAALDEVTGALRSRIFEQAGAVIDAVYICPHLRGDACDCRKPKPGMIFSAAREFGLELSNTLFVGDSPTDLEAALKAGVGTKVLVLCGAARYYQAGQMIVEPDYVFSDLAAVAGWILEVPID